MVPVERGGALLLGRPAPMPPLGRPMLGEPPILGAGATVRVPRIESERVPRAGPATRSPPDGPLRPTIIGPGVMARGTARLGSVA